MTQERQRVSPPAAQTERQRNPSPLQGKKEGMRKMSLPTLTERSGGGTWVVVLVG